MAAEEVPGGTLCEDMGAEMAAAPEDADAAAAAAAVGEAEGMHSTDSDVVAIESESDGEPASDEAGGAMGDALDALAAAASAADAQAEHACEAETEGGVEAMSGSIAAAMDALVGAAAASDAPDAEAAADGEGDALGGAAEIASALDALAAAAAVDAGEDEANDAGEAVDEAEPGDDMQADAQEPVGEGEACAAVTDELRPEVQEPVRKRRRRDGEDASGECSGEDASGGADAANVSAADGCGGASKRPRDDVAVDADADAGTEIDAAASASDAVDALPPRRRQRTQPPAEMPAVVAPEQTSEVTADVASDAVADATADGAAATVHDEVEEVVTAEVQVEREEAAEPRKIEGEAAVEDSASAAAEAVDVAAAASEKDEDAKEEGEQEAPVLHPRVPCWSCGAFDDPFLPPGEYCDMCGVPKNEEKRKLEVECPACGAGYLSDSLFCLRCGAKRGKVARPEDDSLHVVTFAERPFCFSVGRKEPEGTFAVGAVGGPAEEKGIVPGMMLLSVQGRELLGLSQDDVVDILRQVELPATLKFKALDEPVESEPTPVDVASAVLQEGGSLTEAAEAAKEAIARARGNDVDVAEDVQNAVIKAAVAVNNEAERIQIASTAAAELASSAENACESAKRAALDLEWSAEEQMEAGARAGLKAASDSRNDILLEAMLTQGKEAGIGLEDPDMIQVNTMLLQAKARESLAEAAKCRSLPDLLSALQGAVQLGLSEDEMEYANRVMREETAKTEARASLAAAVESRDLKSLRAALRQGRAVSLDASELEEANTVCKEEEAKSAARCELAIAQRSRVIADLRAALSKASEVGVPEDDPDCVAAQQVLEEEEAKVRARAELAEATESARAAAANACDVVAKVLVEEENADAAAKPDASTLTGAADDVASALQRLQLALETASWSGLEPPELAEATAALAEATRQRWRALLVAEPCPLAGSVLLSSLEEILLQGFDVPFLKRYVLSRLASGCLGEPPSHIAAALRRMRSLDISCTEYHASPELMSELETSFLAGIERASCHHMSKLPRYTSALVWLDADASTRTPASSSSQPSRKRPSGEQDLLVLSDSRLVSMSDVAPSGRVRLDLRSSGSSAAQCGLRFYDSSGSLIWASSARNHTLKGSAGVIASISKERSADGVGGSRQSLQITSARLDLEKVGSEVFAICVTAECSNWRRCKTASVRLLEQLEKESASTDRGISSDAERLEIFTQAASAEDLQRGSDRGVRALALLTRGGNLGEGEWGNWVLRGLDAQHSSVPVPRGILDETMLDNAIVSLLFWAYQEAAYPESALLCESGGDCISACVTCTELGRALSSSCGAATRCVVTGVLWSTSRSGALEVPLGAGFLADLRALIRARSRVAAAAPRGAEEAFYALTDHVGLQPPGADGLLLRVGEVPGLPVAAVRGAWGFDRTALCDVPISAGGAAAAAAGEEEERAASARTSTAVAPRRRGKHGIMSCGGVAAAVAGVTDLASLCATAAVAAAA